MVDKRKQEQQPVIEKLKQQIHQAQTKEPANFDQWIQGSLNPDVLEDGETVNLVRGLLETSAHSHADKSASTKRNRSFSDQEERTLTSNVNASVK